MITQLLLLAFLHAQSQGGTLVVEHFQRPFVDVVHDAFAALDRKDEAAAREGFEQALRIRPRSAPCAIALARLDAAHGGEEAALARLEHLADWGFDDAQRLRADLDLRVALPEASFERCMARMRAKRQRSTERNLPVRLADDQAEPLRGGLPLGDPALGADPVDLRAADFALTPDGKRILFEDGSGSLCELDVLTGATLRQVEPPWESNYLREFVERANAVLVTDVLGGMRLLDAGDLRERARADLPERGVALVAGVVLSPLGDRALSIGSGAHAELWSVPELKRVAELDQGTDGRTRAAWSRDGGRLALGETSGSVRIHAAETGARVGPELATGMRVTCLAFHPSGTSIAVGSTGSRVRVFELATGKLVLERTVHEIWPGSSGKSWDLTTRTITFDSKGERLIATVGDYAMARCFSFPAGEALWDFDFEGGNPGAIQARFFGGDRRVVLAGMTAHMARVFDARTGVVLADWTNSDVLHAAPSADGRWIATLGGKSLALFDAESLERVWRRFAYVGGKGITVTRTGHALGEPAAWRRLAVVVDGRPRAIETYAALLFDPLAVRALVEHGDVQAVLLPAAPEVRVLCPTTKELVLEERGLVLELDARFAFGFEVEEVESGRVTTLRAPEGDPTRLHVLHTVALADRDRVTLRVRAIGSLGVMSEPEFVRVDRPK